MLPIERDVSSIIAWQVRIYDEVEHDLKTHPGDLLLIECGRFEEKKDDKRRRFFFPEGVWSKELQFPVVVRGDKVIVFPALDPNTMEEEEAKYSKFVGRVVAVLKKRRR